MLRKSKSPYPVLKVIYAPSSGAAQNFISKNISNDQSKYVAIETEYGDFTLDESFSFIKKFIGHHMANEGENPPAIIFKKNGYPRHSNFIVSHIDADIIFGILWIAGFLDTTDKDAVRISEIIADIDIKGWHVVKREINKIPIKIRDKLLVSTYIINNWIIPAPNKPDEFIDISKQIRKLALKIRDVLIKGPTEKQLKAVNEASFYLGDIYKKFLYEILPIHGSNIFIFSSPFKLNSVYEIEDNLRSIINLNYNELSGSITLSAIDEKTAIEYFGKLGVIEPMQKFFGSGAGGRITIAGTPRGIKYKAEIIDAFLEFLKREYFNTPTETLVKKERFCKK